MRTSQQTLSKAKWILTIYRGYLNFWGFWHWINLCLHWQKSDLQGQIASVLLICSFLEWLILDSASFNVANPCTDICSECQQDWCCHPRVYIWGMLPCFIHKSMCWGLYMFLWAQRTSVFAVSFAYHGCINGRPGSLPWHRRAQGILLVSKERHVIWWNFVLLCDTLLYAIIWVIANKFMAIFSVFI